MESWLCKCLLSVFMLVVLTFSSTDFLSAFTCPPNLEVAKTVGVLSHVEASFL